MPKVLYYITSKITWIFLFWNTDVNENRAHVHVGKKGTLRLCKIWLQPEVELADSGELKESQLKEILHVSAENQTILLNQWIKFKSGKQVKALTIKK